MGSYPAGASPYGCKDMSCEKPMGIPLDDGQAIRDAVRKHPRIFQAGTWQRSARAFRFTCELARNGCFGKPHTVEVVTDVTKLECVRARKDPVSEVDAPPIKPLIWAC